MTARDPRTYITLHDGMPENGKIRPLSDKAFRALIEVWCWCSRERNDGEMSLRAFKTFGTQRARRELIDGGLIEEHDDGTVTVHDYLSHQRSRAQIEQLSIIRSEAGKLGGRPAKAKQTETKMVTKSEAKKTHSHSQIQTDLTTQSKDKLRAQSTSEDRPVDNPVDNRIVAVQSAVASKLGLDLHPLEAVVLVDHYEAKAPTHVKSMPAYLKRCIENEDQFQLSQIIHENGRAS